MALALLMAATYAVGTHAADLLSALEEEKATTKYMVEAAAAEVSADFDAKLPVVTNDTYRPLPTPVPLYAKPEDVYFNVSKYSPAVCMGTPYCFPMYQPAKYCAPFAVCPKGFNLTKQADGHTACQSCETVETCLKTVGVSCDAGYSLSKKSCPDGGQTLLGQALGSLGACTLTCCKKELKYNAVPSVLACKTGATLDKKTMTCLVTPAGFTPCPSTGKACTCGTKPFCVTSKTLYGIDACKIFCSCYGDLVQYACPSSFTS